VWRKLGIWGGEQRETDEEGQETLAWFTWREWPANSPNFVVQGRLYQLTGQTAFHGPEVSSACSHKHETYSEYSPHIHTSYSQNPLEREHIQHDKIQLRIFLFISPPQSLPNAINLVPLPSYLWSITLKPWTLFTFLPFRWHSFGQASAICDGRRNYTFYYNYRHTWAYTRVNCPVFDTKR